jgi:palmitoyl-protein thioesterase
MIRLACIFFLTTVLSSSIYRPVVLMHGITSKAAGMNDIASWLRDSFPGIYVISIEIGDGTDDSFLWPMDKQVQHFCQSVLADEHLRQGFNMLGYSQGSIIVRGALERCSLPVHNLITLSGIHQGVFGIPYLLSLPIQFRDLVTKYAYEEAVQNVISVSNYWRDPEQLDRFRNVCHFLPDINNERSHRNETYRNNMLKLNAFVMTYSDIDEIITPKESGWFMGYAPESLTVETWNSSRQFTEDLIGLRTLWEQGKLYTFVSHVPHQEVPHAPNRDFILTNIFPFFNNTLT